MPDLALLLNATTIDNPADILDDVSNGHRPADWTAGLDANALQGKVIGVPLTAFDDPFRTQGTEDAMRESFKHFVAAGATVKEIPDPPAGPASPPATAATRAGASGCWSTRTRRTRTRRRSCAARCACRSSATPPRTPAPAR